MAIFVFAGICCTVSASLLCYSWGCTRCCTETNNGTYSTNNMGGANVVYLPNTGVSQQFGTANQQVKRFPTIVSLVQCLCNSFWPEFSICWCPWEEVDRWRPNQGLWFFRQGNFNLWTLLETKQQSKPLEIFTSSIMFCTSVCHWEFRDLCPLIR